MLALGASACGEGATAGSADEYPQKPINMVIPYEPGGGVDTTARRVIETIGEYVDVPVRAVPKPGGGGTVGSQQVHQAEPDGYEVLMASSGAIVTPPLTQDVGYQASDFTPIAQVAEVSYVLVVRPNSPHKSFDEMVEYSRSHPDEITYGTSGPGSTGHLIISALTDELGVEWKHVPFDGGASAVAAALGGHVEVAVPGLASTAGQLSQGVVRGLVSTGADSPEQFPDLPTLKDLGHNVAFQAAWIGLLAPPGTPENVVRYLEDALRKVVADPEFVEAHKKESAEPPQFLGSADFGKRIQDETDVLQKVVDKGGL
ncbi:Bug family tripartite tricarboxylate transporter substrate binding protein [Actinophytocola sp.]|uniref:Bug family tripartite tricarboxylate transporter substrate binding protein n=1 Tax=Actinophytocola sp. TaxID=1872138 RepID=UPI003D6BB2F2